MAMGQATPDDTHAKRRPVLMRAATLEQRGEMAARFVHRAGYEAAMDRVLFF